MASAASTGHLVEDFDAAFQNCLAAIMKQEHFNVMDQEETKNSVDQCVQKFVDNAKQLESFFLQKRLLLSVHKPEQILKEDINELKLELQRKDLLIQKHYDKLQQWQNILSRQSQTQQSQGQSQSQQNQQTTPQGGHGQAQNQTQVQGQTHAQGQSPGQASGVVSSQAGSQSGSPNVHVGPSRAHHTTPVPQAQMTPQLQQQHSQPAMSNQQSPGMGMGGMSGGGPAPNMVMGHPSQLQHQSSFPQGPLAYLEQTTSNIGMPERR